VVHVGICAAAGYGELCDVLKLRMLVCVRCGDNSSLEDKAMLELL
jgi:hypothetical protein